MDILEIMERALLVILIVAVVLLLRRLWKFHAELRVAYVTIHAMTNLGEKNKYARWGSDLQQFEYHEVGGEILLVPVVDDPANKDGLGKVDWFNGLLINTGEADSILDCLSQSVREGKGQIEKAEEKRAIAQENADETR